jgi:hypothetical protein
MGLTESRIIAENECLLAHWYVVVTRLGHTKLYLVMPYKDLPQE